LVAVSVEALFYLGGDWVEELLYWGSLVVAAVLHGGTLG
jgi:hypothetical protein